jgi:Ran GTPase-activating protein (RanGAP) involved in mRNA processing and transport
LTVLNLESANIGANGQAALFTTLAKHNFRITTLLLGGSGATTMKNVLGEAGALAAGAAMHSNSTLATLSLADNRLTSAQLQVFSKGLRSNIQLTSLDLSNNVFGDEGVHLLAASLETLQLTYLNLARTEMTDAGACSLAQAVATGRPPIHTLCLSGNRVAAGGAAALTAVIARKNTVLNTLKLDHNNLGPVGMKNMLEKSIYTTTLVKDKHGRPVDVVVHYPRALTDLNLSANGLLDEGAKFAAELMIENSVLTKLDISHNGIGNKGMRGVTISLPVVLCLRASLPVCVD